MGNGARRSAEGLAPVDGLRSRNASDVDCCSIHTQIKAAETQRAHPIVLFALIGLLQPNGCNYDIDVECPGLSVWLGANSPDYTTDATAADNLKATCTAQHAYDANGNFDEDA